MNTMDSLLEITKREQYRTVEELLDRSEPNPIYFTLLILSSIIIAAGLLLNNSTIVIGGMVLTPVLTPVLVIALAISLGDTILLRRMGLLVGKSILVVVAASLVLKIVSGSPSNPIIFNNTIQTAILYFIVALAAGIAATFAWARKEVTDLLPGIAIAVTLVPPLSLIGIWLLSFQFDIVRFYFFVFLLNLIGIITGSVIVFSLLKFHKTEKVVHEKTAEAIKEEKKKLEELKQKKTSAMK